MNFPICFVFSKEYDKSITTNEFNLLFVLGPMREPASCFPRPHTSSQGGIEAARSRHATHFPSPYRIDVLEQIIYKHMGVGKKHSIATDPLMVGLLSRNDDLFVNGFTS